MSSDQDQSLRILDNALWRIAHRGDCEYADEASRPKPCDCPRCVALAALESAKNWRFHGAMFERTQKDHWPREMKMHAAWVKLCGSGRSGNDPDHLLTQILKDNHSPSARDWYVATSVIQWLATNVGMTVLEAAGFKYQQWEQDAADGELFKRRQEYEDNDAKRRDQKGLDRLQRSQLETIDYAGLNPADGPPIGRSGVSASAPYKCNVPMCGDSGVCEECRKRGAK